MFLVLPDQLITDYHQNKQNQILYGPLVMAGDLGPEDDPAAGDPDYVPVFSLKTEIQTFG
jgi:hypothetical protein